MNNQSDLPHPHRHRWSMTSHQFYSQFYGKFTKKCVSTKLWYHIQSTVTKSLDDANDPIIFYIKLSTLKKQTVKEIVCAQ